MGYKTSKRKKRLRRSNKPNSRIIGILKKTKSNRYRVIDSYSEESYKISVRELRKAFVGDKVQCSLTPKRWVQIEKVLESNTTSFIGKLEKFGKSYKALPLDSGRHNYVNINGKVPNAVKISNLVKVKVTQQPTSRSSAKGYIEKVLDNKNPETAANEIAISRFNLRNSWHKNIVNEVKKIQRLDPLLPGTRRDLSSLPFVTIDGKNAKDFDDAVYAEETNKGGYNLYVAIADVSHFVSIDSFIDQEARNRGTSIYFTNKVIPMLPGELSNKLCSLRPNEKKACLVCKVELDSKGKLDEATFFEAIIESKARLTYEETGTYFEKDDYPTHLLSCLQPLKNIYDLLKKQKISRCALELDIPDYLPRFKNNEIQKFIKGKRNIAHQVIEECMLLANISAAQLLLNSQIPSIYRIHPKPDAISIKHLEMFARSRSLNIKIRPEAKVEDFYKLIELASGRKDLEAIHMQILQSLTLASYSEESSGHFALAYKAYTHFTSPIRRYPDLMVHRAIKELIHQNNKKELKVRQAKKTKSNENNYPFNLQAVKEIAEQSSFKEREAEKATRDATNTLKCELAAKHRQKSFKGTITGITNFGIFILLHDLGIDGLCHIKNLPNNDYFVFDQVTKSLKGKSSGKGYFLGDLVSARIREVDISLQRIDLDIAK